MLAPPPLPRNLEAAFRDLGSTRPEVRASAIDDVERHAAADKTTTGGDVHARACSAIAKLLADPVAAVRARAATALGDMKATSALAALLVAVEDESPYVGQMSLQALGDLGDPRATARIARARTDPRAPLRYQAVIAYDKLAPTADEAWDALATAFADADAEVRYIALRVAEERLEKNGGDLPARVAAAAKARIDDAAANVAIAAAILLAKAGDAAGRGIVVDVVRGAQKAAIEDEREAVELAGSLGIAELVPDLERRAVGPKTWFVDTCKLQARASLARLGHTRAAAEILRDLGSRREAVRSSAVVAAGRAKLRAARRAIAAMGPESIDPVLRDEALAAIGE